MIIFFILFYCKWRRKLPLRSFLVLFWYYLIFQTLKANFLPSFIHRFIYFKTFDYQVQKISSSSWCSSLASLSSASGTTESYSSQLLIGFYSSISNTYNCSSRSSLFMVRTSCSPVIDIYSLHKLRHSLYYSIFFYFFNFFMYWFAFVENGSNCDSFNTTYLWAPFFCYFLLSD